MTGNHEYYENMPFKCTLCPLKYNDKQEFQSHVRDHFKPITCADCNKTFIGDKQYSYHQKHVHGTKATKEPLTENENQVRLKRTTKIEIDNESTDEISFDSVESITSSVACDICGRLFVSKIQFGRINYITFLTRFFFAQANAAAVVRHRKTHSNEGKRFFCNVCSNGFNKKTNLEFHLRIHTNER